MEDLSQESFDTLLNILDEEDVQRRTVVAQELGRRAQAGETRAIPVLIRMLSDSGDHVAEIASDVLWPLGEPTVTPLIELLEDRAATHWGHIWAARTFTYLGDSRGAEPMRRLVQDPMKAWRSAV